jgi:hypothetical protein
MGHNGIDPLAIKHTVAGRNHAPVGRWFIPIYIYIYSHEIHSVS